MQSKTLIYVLLTFTSFSCYFDKEDLLYEDVMCDTENVRFSEEIMPIIRNNCATVGCHVQGGNGNGIFENYDQIKSKVDNGSLRERVVVRRDMPPSGPLDDCTVQHFRSWIENGAPDN